MIHLRANNGNTTGQATIVMTLTEKCTLENPYFTFRIVHKDSKEETIFNGLDISSNPEIYNKFLIEITESTPFPTLGKINAKSGEYNYYIYESPTLGELTISECTGIIEQGILKIERDSVEIPAYQNLSSSIKVYKGQ